MCPHSPRRVTFCTSRKWSPGPLREQENPAAAGFVKPSAGLNRRPLPYPWRSRRGRRSADDLDPSRVTVRDRDGSMDDITVRPWRPRPACSLLRGGLPCPQSGPLSHNGLDVTRWTSLASVFIVHTSDRPAVPVVRESDPRAIGRVGGREHRSPGALLVSCRKSVPSRFMVARLLPSNHRAPGSGTGRACRRARCPPRRRRPGPTG